MKTSIGIALGLTLSVALAGCGKQGETSKPTESTAPPAMAMPAEIKHGKGTGTVTAIDSAKDEVTLDHGAIAELEWPPMAMSFAAKPELLKDIKVGDKVTFELDWDGKAGTVTKIDKTP